MSPPREFVELPQGMRARIEATIKSLIDILDQIDGDADFEPSLGSVGISEWSNQVDWAAGGAQLGEDEDGRDDEPTGDEEEPTLGATTAISQCAAWAPPRPVWFTGIDGELEPSLGWTGNARGAPGAIQGGYDGDREFTTGPRDEEWEDASGIADRDGLAE